MLSSKYLKKLRFTLLITILGAFVFSTANGNVSQWSAQDLFQNKEKRTNAESNSIDRELASKKSGKINKNNLSILRPITQINSLNNKGDYLLQKSFIENLYSDSFTKHVQAEYQNRVGAIESRIESPYKRATIYDISQYNQSRSDMANWTAKEILDHQFRELFRNGDKDSGAMQVVSAVRQVTGGESSDVKKEKEKNVSLVEKEKILRAHQLELQKEEEEAPIATKLKKRFNLIKGFGQLSLQNPIVSTAINVDVNDKNNKVSMDMNKEFKKLKMNSSARYGFSKKILNLNVNKSVTDRISVSVNSDRYLGNTLGASGEKSIESAKINYSLSF